MRAGDQPKSHTPYGDGGGAWGDRREELARWAQERLVVRRDCYGAYTPPEQRGRTYTRQDGTPAKVPQSYTAKGELTLATLARHFRGTRPEHVIGLHSTSTANACLAARVDIDAHGPGGNDPAANLRAALAWHGRLTALGFSPLLYGSNGRGGFHLAALFREPVPAPLTFAFLRWLTGDHAHHGLPVRPEVFPKQPRVPEGGFGNWLRLVGRHHTRDWWPNVWAGDRWLTGAETVDFILSLAGDAPALIPAEARAQERPAVRVNVRFVPAHPTPHAGSLERRIRGYMARLPNLGEGQGRDNVGYSFACWLVRDLGLSDETALPWLEQWDRGNSPPKGTQRLLEIMGSARRYGRHPVACATGGHAS
jgi:hypothetical protein